MTKNKMANQNEIFASKIIIVLTEPKYHKYHISTVQYTLYIVQCI